MLPPAVSTALPVEKDVPQLSGVKWTVLRLQDAPVSTGEAAPVMSTALSLPSATELTAKAIAVLFTSAMASTPSSPNHCRAMEEATSALRRWSAVFISTVKPCCSGWKSSMACLAASTVVGPELSLY